MSGRFHNLEDDEVVLLTEEQIEHYIAVETAYAGVKPAQKPVAPDYKDVELNASITGYGIEFGYSTCMWFKDIESAEMVAKLTAYDSTYISKYGSDYPVFGKERDGIKIKTQMFYTEEDLQAVSDDLEANKALKDIFDTENNRYNTFVRETQKIKDNIYDRLHQLQRFKVELEEARKQLEEHFIPLAGGDEEIAKRFFVHAHSEEDAICWNLIGEDWKDYLQAAYDITEEDDERKKNS